MILKSSWGYQVEALLVSLIRGSHSDSPWVVSASELQGLRNAKVLVQGVTMRLRVTTPFASYSTYIEDVE